MINYVHDKKLCIWTEFKPSAPCGAPWSWAEPGQSRHGRRESGSASAFSAGSSTVPSTAAIPSVPSCPPRSLGCPFPSRWHCPAASGRALGRMRCCRHKERFSHYTFGIEGMRSLVFHALYLQGLDDGKRCNIKVTHKIFPTIEGNTVKTKCQLL